MQRALNRLTVTGKRKAGPDNRPPLVDIFVPIENGELERLLGARVVRRLQAQGITTTGVRIGTVMLGSFLKALERVTRPVVSRSAVGITNERLPTSDEVLSKYQTPTGKR